MTARVRPADGASDGASDNDAGAPTGSRLESGVAVRYRVLALVAIFVASIAAAVFIADPLATAPAVEDPAAVGAASTAPGAGTAAVAGPGAWQRPALSADALAATVGVRVSQLALTGGGGLIDLRLQVVDPVLAEAVHDPVYPIAIVDEATGVVAHSMLMGHSHTDKFQPGHVYYFVIENPGNVIQRNAKVSVLLGGAELDNVEVL